MHVVLQRPIPGPSVSILSCNKYIVLTRVNELLSNAIERRTLSILYFCFLSGTAMKDICTSTMSPTRKVCGWVASYLYLWSASFQVSISVSPFVIFINVVGIVIHFVILTVNIV